MWRRLLDFTVFWIPAIVHVGLLVTAMVVTFQAQARSAAVQSTPGRVGVVLRPLGDLHGSTRTVVTNAGDLRLRRTCEAARCELFAGTDRGYSLLASYPADSTVDLRAWPDVEITRIYRSHERPTALLVYWLAAFFSGFLALSFLGRRLSRERRELDWIEPGQDALMTEDGQLLLADGRRVRVSQPLPRGPALALWREGRGEARVGGTPYRVPAVEIWMAVRGSKTDHLLRIGAALGATKVAMIAIVCVNLAALGTGLVRLT